MMKALPKSTLLRRAIEQGCVMMPGAFNAATARLVERSGFAAVYVSGAGLANATAGVPDIGVLTLTEVAQLAGYIADAVRIPALADADTGFGGPENVVRTVHAFERAGLAGMHLEDQSFPKRCGHLAGKELIPIEEVTAKIAAAAQSRRFSRSLPRLGSAPCQRGARNALEKTGPPNAYPPARLARTRGRCARHSPARQIRCPHLPTPECARRPRCSRPVARPP